MSGGISSSYPYKILLIDPLTCNGCRECEIVCAARHAGNRKIAQKRIRVLGAAFGDASLFVPSTCRQCADPPCMAVCPRNAIRLDHVLKRVVLDPGLCVGCAMCVAACPNGSMAFADELGLPYKCELCDGDPECVRACETQALKYVELHELHHPRVRRTAHSFVASLYGPRNGIIKKTVEQADKEQV
jgi:Fe-S-cluster-containing hydrogenase component 2